MKAAAAGLLILGWALLAVWLAMEMELTRCPDGAVADLFICPKKGY